MAESRGRLIERQPVRVEVLSPLHIGSGAAPLQRDLDFLVDGDLVRILDIDVLAGALAGRGAGVPRPADVFARMPHLREAATFRRLNLSGGQSSPQIRTFTRTGFDNAYLPGSTLKGAIRTALAWQAYGAPLDLRQLERRPEFAARALEKQIFGPDPNHDALRAVRCADCPAREGSPFEVAAASIQVRVRDRSDLPVLQARATGQNTIHVEAASRGAIFAGSVEIDRGLLDGRLEGARRLDLGPASAAVPDWMDACRGFGLALIEHERRFFAEAAPRGEARRFYDRLAEEGSRLGPEEAILQLGWGTSWRAKTVGLRLTEQEIGALRDRYAGPLSRWHGAEFPRLFPKTRKLCDDREGRPGQPLGWVRLMRDA